MKKVLIGRVDLNLNLREPADRFSYSFRVDASHQLGYPQIRAHYEASVGIISWCIKFPITSCLASDQNFMDPIGAYVIFRLLET